MERSTRRCWIPGLHWWRDHIYKPKFRTSGPDTYGRWFAAFTGSYTYRKSYRHNNLPGKSFPGCVRPYIGRWYFHTKYFHTKWWWIERYIQVYGIISANEPDVFNQWGEKSSKPKSCSWMDGRYVVTSTFRCIYRGCAVTWLMAQLLKGASLNLIRY